MQEHLVDVWNKESPKRRLELEPFNFFINFWLLARYQDCNTTQILVLNGYHNMRECLYS
jgi:hypothetical protein